MSQLASLISSLQDLLSGLTTEQQSSIELLIKEGELHQQATWAGHMTPTIDSPALLGQILSSLHNGNLLSADLYPKLAFIESQLINLFCQLFRQRTGHFTHGSSYANLEALWQAREHGNDNANIVYSSAAAHYSIAKACRILGLEFQVIETDEQGKMQIQALRSACEQNHPVAIVATAGTSSCGAIDPLAECISIARNVDSWCHIDAAWGGSLAFLDDYDDLSPAKYADSVCFDPHKALGQPKPCSILLYQHALEQFTDLDIDYLSQIPKKTLIGSYGGELFLPLWCSLFFNKEQLTEQLNWRLQQAELFAIMLKQHSNWTVWHSPTGIVCFKPMEDIDLSNLEKAGVFSRSKINHHSVYRAVFASHTTQAEKLFTELAPYL